MTSPESADISHRSLGVSPHNEGNNNTNTKSKTTSTSNQQPTGTYLSFGTGALSMTPTTTRISGHFDNLASPTAVQFSDSIIRSANNIKTNSKRSSDIYPLPHPSSSIDQWPVYATKLDDTENLRRRSQYNNNTTDGSHHHYISPQQPSTYTINNMNGDERFIHRDDCVMTTQGPRQTNHHHFTGNRYHSDVVNIKLMQDVPAWLKSLRLHKYTHLFETMTWQAIISLTNDELVEKGVATLGARRKLLKVFDQVKQHCDMMNIKHETE
ncbi:hypothetical protein BC941DRAFT_411575 [Chlamydoabsidia padenii]|nr:hypothetical protein BC941DRAFT_411575 [Chlamydoabsidia padenii]